MRRSFNKAALFVGSVVAMRAAFVACTGTDFEGGDKAAGDEGGPCFADKTCRTGLDCLSDRCVRSPDNKNDGGSLPGVVDGVDASDANVVITPVCEPGAPCTIPNLVAWYRADRGVAATNGAVTEWQDQSAKGNHARLLVGDTAPAFIDASAIFGGGPRVEFDGLRSATPAPVAERLVTNAFATPFNTGIVYVVFSRANDPRPAGYIVDGIRSGARNVVSLQQNKGQMLAAFSINGELVVVPDTPTLFEAVFNGVDSGLTTNGSSTTEGDLGIQTFAGLTIGSSHPDAAATTNFAGSIAELVVFSGTLSANDRATVVRWLRTRHGF